ncbi:hypothetical protein C1N71_14720 [Agrococcus sp. SGAir0287]|nr:hypothetical protein C1N71_14720 [Agrococcus sp. SGAir0287]
MTRARCARALLDQLGWIGPRPAGWNGPRPAGWNGPRPAGWNGPGPAGWNGPRPAGWNGPRPAGVERSSTDGGGAGSDSSGLPPPAGRGGRSRRLLPSRDPSHREHDGRETVALRSAGQGAGARR